MEPTPTQIGRTDARADFDYAVSDRIGTLRKRVGVTQRQLALAIGITESSMSDKLHLGPWNAWELSVIAPMLNTSIDVLYGVDPMPEPTRPARVTRLDPKRNARKITNGYLAAGRVTSVDFTRSARTAA